MQEVLEGLGAFGGTIGLVVACGLFFGLGLWVKGKLMRRFSVQTPPPVVVVARPKYDLERPPQIHAILCHEHTAMCSYSGMPSGCLLRGIAAGTPIWEVKYWECHGAWVSSAFFLRTPEGEDKMKRFYREKFGITLELLTEVAV